MNVADIKTEFGAFYIDQGQNASNLIQMLYHKSETELEFQTVVTDNDIWRESKATITRLLQPFQKQWTPLGTTKFEPCEIRQFPMKIDYEDWPDDLRGTWLGFLLDNKLDRTQWPIVRYIIEKLIIPQSQQDFELNEAYKGVFAAPTAGTPGGASTSINGVEKWITDAVGKGVAPITMGAIPTSDADFVDYVEDFCKQIDSLYRNAALTPLFMNPDLALKYYYGFGDKYGQRTDFTGETMTVKGTNIRVKGLQSMAGHDRLWITPKGNAKRLVKETVNQTNFKLESLKRQIFLYTDFYKGLGFSLLELLFFSDQD